MRMNVYRLSTLVSVIEADARTAWYAARAAVRAMAAAEGARGEVVAQMANQPFIQVGAYRALPERAQR